jgi:hypothetical protein
MGQLVNCSTLWTRTVAWIVMTPGFRHAIISSKGLRLLVVILVSRACYYIGVSHAPEWYEVLISVLPQTAAGIITALFFEWCDEAHYGRKGADIAIPQSRARLRQYPGEGKPTRGWVVEELKKRGAARGGSF